MKNLTIIDNFEKENLKFQNRFETALEGQKKKINLSYIHFSELEKKKIINRVMDSDGIILNGSYNSLSESQTVEKYQKVIDLIKIYSKPLLGICFGHQQLGIANGFEVGPMTHPEKKIEMEKSIDLEIIQPVEIIKHSKIKAYVTHYQEIKYTPRFDAIFNLHASTDACKLHVISHKVKPHYGVQFHPETPDDPVALKYGIEILNNFINIM